MDIDIRYDELEKVGGEILALSSELEDVVSELTQIGEILELNWTGIDATKYLQTLREQYLTGLKNLKELFDENGNYLLTISKIYETFDNNMASDARKCDLDGDN